MKQTSLIDGYEKSRKKARNEKFLDDMETTIHWKQLCAGLEPFYPNLLRVGRRPVGIEQMLRIYFLQNGFNLSGLAAEEALNDSLAMRQFFGIDPGEEDSLKTAARITGSMRLKNEKMAGKTGLLDGKACK